MASQHGDKIDGFGDERARHGDHRLLHALFKTAQRADD